MKDLIIKEVDFQGNKIISTIIDSKVYISVKNVCDNLGMDETQRRNQRAKVQNDEFLKGGLKFTPLFTKGGIQETLMIELDYLPIWLAKINPARFDKELKEKLMIYQLKAKDVLSEAFFGKREDEITLLPEDKDWALKRIHDRADQAKILEDQASHIIGKLQKIYKEIAGVADLKKRTIGNSFFSFKEDGYDASKEKLPVIVELEIEKENLDKINELDLDKNKVLEDIVKNKTLENTIKVLEQKKLKDK